MKKTAYIITACILFFIAGGLYYFLREEPIAPPPAQETKTDSAVKAMFIGNSIVEEQEGKRLWELSAEKIELAPNSKQILLHNLTGIFYQDKGGTIQITAPEAVVDTNTKDIIMTGSVKAVASDGATFIAQEARWAGADRRLFGSGGVRLMRDDAVLTGDRLESDANMEKVRVEGNARVVRGGAFN